MSESFCLPDFLEKDFLLRLDQYAVIEINGSDALEFLHNQFTNDLKNLEKNHSVIGAWCSPKGRVLYTFRIWRLNNTFYVILPTVQTASFLKRLQMYILRAEVSAVKSNKKHVFGISGKNSDQYLQNIPQNDNEFYTVDNDIVIRLPSSVSRFLIITDQQDFRPDNLPASIDLENSLNHWKLLDISAGIPEILPETADMFLPQMLNLEQLGGLSFQKGCYPGQEIVARVKYRGDLKKQLYNATISTTHDIKPGTPLITPGGKNDVRVGHLVNVAQLDENTWIVLAVININSAENDVVKLQNDHNSIIQLKAD